MTGLSGRFRSGDAAIAVPDTQHAGALAQDADGRMAAIAGHPHWLDSELAALALAAGPAEALLAAWHSSGEGLFKRIGGDFVCAVVDPVSGRAVAGIDRLGQHPLHFARLPDGGIAFASSADDVLATPGIRRELTPAGLFHYLYYHMLPAPLSLFAGVTKLQGGQYVLYHRGAARVISWWRPRFVEPQEANITALGDELRDLLEASVGRLQDQPQTGAFLSGGLDSSTVAGMLAKQRPGAADTFSIGFDAEGYDEMAYARIAVNHFSTHAHEYYVTPDDVVAAVPRIAAEYDEPFGNSSALPAWFCARMAADAGMQRLLAGDGGDELFAGNERYAKQAVFDRWSTLPALLRRGLIEPLVRILPGAVPLVGKAQRYIAQANVPLPDRLQAYNFLHRIALEAMFDPEFLAQIDPDAPMALMREIYHRPDEASPLNRMMYLDWQQTLADNDLRKVSRMCALAGVDVAYPMLDDALVEFSCRVPSDLKLKDGRLRHFYKEALSGFLPPEIIDKKKHGFGLPFGVWMTQHAPLRELAYDNVMKLKSSGVLRPEFIDEGIRLHREGHAGYYGELIWVLMMLQLWMDSHR